MSLAECLAQRLKPIFGNIRRPRDDTVQLTLGAEQFCDRLLEWRHRNIHGLGHVWQLVSELEHDFSWIYLQDGDLGTYTNEH